MVGRRRKRKNQIFVRIVVPVSVVVLCIVIGFVLHNFNHKEEFENIMVPRFVNDKKQGEIINEADVEFVKVRCNKDVVLKDLEMNPIGMALNFDVNAGGIITSFVTHKESDISDTERFQKFNDISIFKNIMPGDYVDVRISFANGEDYIIMGHKRVEEIEDDAGIVIKVDEEDILKMSSAKVDMSTYDGTKIYAVKYVERYQEASTVYYLANKCVAELSTWDPNLVESIFTTEELKNRSVLESKLKKYEIKEN